MSKEAVNFLQVEQAAQQVLEALKGLKEEAVSYKTATKELEAVREKLLGLITSIETIGKDTHHVVSLIKSIGGPELLQRIDRVKVLSTIAIVVSLLSLAGVVALLIR